MKRSVLIAFLGLLLFFCFSSCSSIFRIPKEYSSEVGCLWVKPADIDKTKINPALTYEIEGSLPDGKTIIVLVSGTRLEAVMELNYDDLAGKMAGSKVEGNVFSLVDLGKKSILSVGEIKNKKRFDPKQRAVLLRDRKKRKYELRSVLPIRATGKITIDENGKYRIIMNTEEESLFGQY